MSDSVEPFDILRHMGDGVIVLDSQTRVAFANQAMAKMLRAGDECLEGRSFADFLAETELLRVVGVEQILNVIDVEYMQVVFMDMTETFVAASVTASAMPIGEEKHCVLVCRDNTEVQELLNESSRLAVLEMERADRHLKEKLVVERREQQQRETGQAQKLESIGQLAAGIAHEINTPVQFIGDNVSFLQQCFGRLVPLAEQVATWCEAGTVTDEDLRGAKKSLRKAKMKFLLKEVPTALSQTMDGVQHVAKIVRAMKEFSHPSSGEKRPVDVQQAIESTVIVCRSEWKYVADLVTNFDPGLPNVPCQPDEFNQVVLNLVVNAAHAIGELKLSEKGRITITTRHLPPYAEVRIQDSGVGISEENLAKIFDPFFTTKEVGKGTGQGLALAYSVIVTKHGGTIHAESNAGEGATFVIRIPLAGSSAGDELEPSAA